MAYKQIWLPFGIESLVNIEAKNGTKCAHCLVRDDVILEMKAAGVAIIEDWKDLPLEFKTKTGRPIHDFAGWDSTTVAKAVATGDI